MFPRRGGVVLAFHETGTDTRIRGIRRGREPALAWIEANGVSLRYMVEGHGPLVVLVHEMGGTLESWDRLMPALLNGGHRVLRYDMRNAGLSERGTAAFGFADLADDLAGLCAALQLEPAQAVVGCAFGGAVALSHAARHPDGVRSVLAIAPAVGVPPERRDAVRERARMLRAEGMRPTQDTRLAAPWPPEHRSAPPIYQDFWLRRVAADPEATARQLEVLADADLRDDLAAITCPVTVLAGLQDRERPPAVVSATARQVGAEGAVFRSIESGHFMAFQSPDLVMAELRLHLTRLRPHPAASQYGGGQI